MERVEKIKQEIKERQEELDRMNCTSDSNIFGILGFIFAFLFPIVGAVLGIISLVKNEKKAWLGIWAIIISVLNFIIGALILFG
jgi:hypothetical protein